MHILQLPVAAWLSLSVSPLPAVEIQPQVPKQPASAHIAIVEINTTASYIDMEHYNYDNRHTMVSSLEADLMGLRVESDPNLCFVPLTLDLESWHQGV